MKLTCNVGAYGWQHQHWAGVYYPDDLPQDWQLAYYSNDFRTVLVPAEYWQTVTVEDCGEWLDAVDDDFQFFAEVSLAMFAGSSFASIAAMLEVLKPQLSAVVVLENIAESDYAPEVIALLQQLEVEIYTADQRLTSERDTSIKTVWQQTDSQPSDMSIFSDDLNDLRASRAQFEHFIQSYQASSMQAEEINVIVRHAQLQLEALRQFRSVLQIMGY